MYQWAALLIVHSSVCKTDFTVLNPIELSHKFNRGKKKKNNEKVTVTVNYVILAL